jgi:hypothetical protein
VAGERRIVPEGDSAVDSESGSEVRLIKGNGMAWHGTARYSNQLSISDGRERSRFLLINNVRVSTSRSR